MKKKKKTGREIITTRSKHNNIGSQREKEEKNERKQYCKRVTNTPANAFLFIRNHLHAVDAVTATKHTSKTITDCWCFV